MFALLFIVFIATTTFSIQGMEIVEKKNPKKKSKSGLLRKRHSYSESPNSTNNTNQTNTQTEYPITTEKKSNQKQLRKSLSDSHSVTNSKQISCQAESFLRAIKENQENKIENCLANPYFNPNEYSLKTAINLCLENKHYALLPVLFRDPRVDISIQQRDLIANLTIIKQEQLRHDNILQRLQLKKQLQQLEQEKILQEILHQEMPQQGTSEQKNRLQEEMDDILAKINLLSAAYKDRFGGMTLDIEINEICSKLQPCNEQKEMLPQENTLEEKISSIIKQVKFLSEIYRSCFSRMTLDTKTNEICRKLQPCNEQGCIEPKIVHAAAEKIKNNIIKVEQKQVFSNEKKQINTNENIKQKQSDSNEKEEENDTDREMPEAACFPDYADTEFMIKKVWFNLSNHS